MQRHDVASTSSRRCINVGRYSNSKNPDQPANLHILIRVFAIYVILQSYDLVDGQ